MCEGVATEIVSTDRKGAGLSTFKVNHHVLFDQVNLAMRLRDLPSLPGYHALFHLEPAWRKRHQFNSRLRVSAAEMQEATRLVDQLEQELQQCESGFQFVATSIFTQLVQLDDLVQIAGM